MNDLQAKLATLEAQLAAAKAELEAAKTKAAQTDDLHTKLEHLTRARAAQDLISSLEQEISTVQNAIAEAQRLEHRQGLLDRARGIAAEVEQCQSELDGLLSDIAKAVHRLQRQAPQIISRWRQSRERFVALFYQIEGVAWPDAGGDVHNSARLERLRQVVAELGPEGQNLLQLPPHQMPVNRLEQVSHESRNWTAAPPQTAQDYALYVLNALLNQPYTQQPAAVLAPDPALSL